MFFFDLGPVSWTKSANNRLEEASFIKDVYHFEKVVGIWSDLPGIFPRVSPETSWDATRSSDFDGRSRYIRWRWSSSVTSA
jgi:hypothetical protein